MCEAAERDARIKAASGRHGCVVGLAGWSGSGKTTLAEKLIAGLCAGGARVASIKHAHHEFDADTPGKDSYRHRKAGARQVLVSSRVRQVLFSEHKAGGERRLEELLDALDPADFVIVEGFKAEPVAKIEILRRSLGKPALYTGDPRILAVVTDDVPWLEAQRDAPALFAIDDIDAITGFITGLAARDRTRGAQ